MMRLRNPDSCHHPNRPNPVAFPSSRIGSELKLFSPPATQLLKVFVVMAMEPTFLGLIVKEFGEQSKVEEWLSKEELWTAEDFSMLAASEEEVSETIIKPAKAAGVKTDALRIVVGLKKLWKQTRKDEEAVPATGDAAEADQGLDEKHRRSCEATWTRHHNMVLAPCRRLVSTQMRPMWEMSHAIPPSPKDFSLLPVHKMRLQDGSIKDGEIKQLHVVYVKLRAFFMSYAWVNINNLAFFTCDAAEAMSDKVLTLLHAHHPNGRPPHQILLGGLGPHCARVSGGCPLWEVADLPLRGRHHVDPFLE